jgi:hypothetical protein
MIGGLPADPPDPYISVIKVLFADNPPYRVDEPDTGAWRVGEAGLA